MANKTTVLAVIIEGPIKGTFVKFDMETSTGEIITDINDVAEHYKADAKQELREARQTRQTLDDLLHRVEMLDSLREGDKTKADSERRLFDAQRSLMVTQTERAQIMIQRLELQMNAIEEERKITR